MNITDRILSPERRDTKLNLINLYHVNITYKDSRRKALSNVDFELQQGESVLFLGPSGCGKSTLAMLCAGLIPGSVEAEVTGEVTQHERVQQPGGVGYVFQDPDSQFCMIQVGDEVAFGLENLQIEPNEMGALVESSLHKVGLKTSKQSQHADFSGGMKQKLAIASALAMKSELLIFDEPTANLDPYASSQVFKEIQNLAEAGQTMLVIEHKFDRLLDVMDRVVLFREDGSIYRTGPTNEVVTAEWQWMVDTGVVAPWKTPPGKTQREVHLERPPADGISFLSNQSQEAGTENSLSQQSLQKVETSAKSNLPPAVEAVGGTLRYGEHIVWEDVTVSVPAGSFTAIVGPNGAGKSSLLQSIAGLQSLSSGTLSVYGRRLRDWSKSKLSESVSFCFQNPEFQFVYERVGDELANQVVKDDVPKPIRDLLSQFGLEGYEQHSPFALSQGQKRRLSVASMLREQHDIYLLDEPTFGQDAHTQQMIMDRMTQLHRDGKTIVMTTHDMDLVNRYASHVLVLSDGKLQFYGAPHELWSQSNVLQSAHLLADTAGYQDPQEFKNTVPTEDEWLSEQQKDEIRNPPNLGREDHAEKSTALNPVWKLGAVILFAAVAMFANTLQQSLSLFVLSIFVMLWFGKMTPWSIVKRFSPFLVFYIFYVFTFVAYSRVPPGQQSVHFLWMNLSMHGLYNGGVLAFRMLSAVGAALFLLSTTPMTDMVVSLCQNAKIPPKFSYGVLAGLRLIPLFRNEWVKLRQARQLRGRDAKRAWMRPVTYAIPLLSQAIRMSERVAVAMEARGLVGEAAGNPQYRTYYRKVERSWRDVFFLVFLNLLAIVLLLSMK